MTAGGVWATRGHPGFRDVEDRLARLSGPGDQLEAFAKVVDFEMVRAELEEALRFVDPVERRGRAVPRDGRLGPGRKGGRRATAALAGAAGPISREASVPFPAGS